MTDKFSQIRSIASQLASRALAEAAGAGADAAPQGAGAVADGSTVGLGVAAARLLLVEEPGLYAGLSGGFKRLAAIGRPWATVGVTPGMTSVPEAGPGGPAGPGAAGGRSTPALADPAGHVRDVYHPFVLHLHLAAYLRRYESMPVGVWGACEDAMPEAVAPARQVEAWTESPPPVVQTAVSLWQALCLLEEAQAASRDADVEVVDAVVHQLLSQPGPGGALHLRSDEESLDAWTYRELCGLHALAGLALRRPSASWRARVEQIAMYHLENTQPDNTTNQPWGVFAFAWSDRTRSFAEQQVHDASVHGGTGTSGGGSTGASGGGGPASGGGTAASGGGATSGGGLSIMAAMLLADAADALRLAEPGDQP